MATTNPSHGSSIEAVVFDLDGVLVDSEPLWDEVRRSLASDSGQPWPVDATRAMQGMSTPEWASYLATVVGVPGSSAVVASRVIDLMAARYVEHLPLLPDAVATVARLGERWPLGLASSSPRRLIDSVLSAAGLTGRFAATVSTEEVVAGKPSPAVYQSVITALGTSSGRTVAIEDSSNGLRSAAAAGLIVVAVPQAAFPPAADALALASTVVDGLAGLTVERIEELG